MVLTLCEGRAYIQFALAKLISLSTIFMEYLCLQMSEAHDSSFLECEVGNLSDEQRKDMQDLVSRHADKLISRLGVAQLLGNTGLFISPSGTSELDCATTKKDREERSISIGRESLKVFLY